MFQGNQSLLQNLHSTSSFQGPGMKDSVIPSRPVASSTELWIALERGWHHKDKC